MTRSLLLASTLALAAGCADKIDHGAAPPDAGSPPGKITTTRNTADGTYTSVVDATSETAWIYADFETGTAVAASDAWDLRFQRFHISTNGGVSGAGGVQVAPVTGTAFADLHAAPTTGFLADAADGNGDGMPDYAFEQGDGWYDYDPTTHVLAPFPTVWVVKTDGGATLKLEIVKYYDDAGTSGWLTLHWGPL
ncbi:MAG TPA: HmuY family protein [Kofleriaceae bacterium]|nr:HmuY family protein [Kofleriaceae bacterium]